MSAYKKNILVAVTVVVALVLLGWMMLKFGTAPVNLFAQEKLSVTFETQQAGGISQGSPVEYRGMNVGHVMGMKRSLDNRTIIIRAEVDKEPPLPGNLEGLIRSSILSGSSRIELVLIGSRPAASFMPATAPSTRAVLPIGQLRENQTIPAYFAGPDILPPEFTDLAYDLRESSRELRRLMQAVDQQKIVPKLANTLDVLNEDMIKAGRVMDSANAMIGDPKLRENILAAMDNLRKASDSATRIASNLEKLSTDASTKVDEIGGKTSKLITSAQSRLDELATSANDRLVQIGKALDNIEKATRKLNEGNGSAARLLNDPKLYENLLDSSKELSMLMADVRRLVEQWEQEGVYLKLSNKK